MYDYNFFSIYVKERHLKKIDLVGKEKYIYIAAASIVIFGILVSGFIQIRIMSTKSKLAKLDTDINSQNKSATGEVGSIQSELEAKNIIFSNISIFENYILEKSKVDDILLKKITAALPNGIYINNMNFSAEKYEITAVAKNKIYIAEFQQNIRNLEIAEELYIPEITELDGYYSFVLTLKN